MKHTDCELASETVNPIVAQNFTYHGGWVITHPHIVLEFWGFHSTEQVKALTAFVDRVFCTPGPYLNNLHQFGVQPAILTQIYFERQKRSTLSNAEIQQILLSQIKDSVLPKDPSTCVLIFLDDQTSVIDPGEVLCGPHANAFGYHDYFIANTCLRPHVYYAVIPGLSDTCLRQSCQVESKCSLNLGMPQIERLTQVASHEFAEMVTDPEPEYFTANGWYALVGGELENADVFNGLGAYIGTDRVQRFYGPATPTGAFEPKLVPEVVHAPYPSAPPKHWYDTYFSWVYCLWPF